MGSMLYAFGSPVISLALMHPNVQAVKDWFKCKHCVGTERSSVHETLKECNVVQSILLKLDRFVIMSVSLSLLAPTLAVLTPLGLWSNWWARRWVLHHTGCGEIAQRVAIVGFGVQSGTCRRIVYPLIGVGVYAICIDLEFGTGPTIICLGGTGLTLIVATLYNSIRSGKCTTPPEELKFIDSQLFQQPIAHNMNSDVLQSTDDNADSAMIMDANELAVIDETDLGSIDWSKFDPFDRHEPNPFEFDPDTSTDGIEGSSEISMDDNELTSMDETARHSPLTKEDIPCPCA